MRALLCAIVTIAATGVGVYTASPAHADTVSDPTIYLADSASGVVAQPTLPSGADSWTTTGLGAPATAVAVSPDAATVYYVTKTTPATLVGVDTTTGSPTSTITLPDITASAVEEGLAISPDGSTALVAGYLPGRVLVVDLVAKTVTHNISPGSGGIIDAVAFTADGTSAIAAATGDNTLYFLNPDTGISTSNMIMNPSALTISPRGDLIAVSHDTPGEGFNPALSLVSVASRQTAAIVTPNDLGTNSGTGILSSAFSPDGSRVYSLVGNGQVAVIDSSSGQVMETNDLDPTSDTIYWDSRLAISPDGNRLYIVTDSTVTRLNVADLGVSQSWSWPAGTYLSGIALAPDLAPTAVLTASPPASDATVQFDASASTVPVGTIATYEWDFGDGTAATTTVPQVSHRYLTPGNYTAAVTLTSSGGTSMSDWYDGQGFVRNGDQRARTSVAVTVPTPTPLTVTIDNPGDQQGTIGIPIDVLLAARTSDGTPVQYTADTLPPGLTLDNATGHVSGTPQQAGSYPVTVTACAVTAPDQCASASFDWQIVPAPSPSASSSTSPPSGAPLPTTGLPSTVPVGIGIGALVLGAVLLAVGRRRAAH